MEGREAELAQIGQLSMGGAGAGMQAALENEVGRLKTLLDAMKGYILCFEVQLLDPQLLSMCTRYYRLVARWLVAAAQPPAQGLPLSPVLPRLFAALPEHCMEDVASYLKHLMQLAPQARDATAPQR